MIRLQMQCGAKTLVSNDLHVCALYALFSLTEPIPGKRKAIVFIVWGQITPNYFNVALLCLHKFRSKYKVEYINNGKHQHKRKRLFWFITCKLQQHVC